MNTAMRISVDRSAKSSESGRSCPDDRYIKGQVELPAIDGELVDKLLKQAIRTLAAMESLADKQARATQAGIYALAHIAATNQELSKP
jgi:hypothetical protein